MAVVCKTKDLVRQTSGETRKIKKLEKEVDAQKESCTKLDAELKASKSKCRAKNKELRESKAEHVKLLRVLKKTESDLEISKCSNNEYLRIIHDLKRKLDEPKGPSGRSPQGEFGDKMPPGFIRKVRG